MNSLPTDVIKIIIRYSIDSYLNLCSVNYEYRTLIVDHIRDLVKSTNGIIKIGFIEIFRGDRIMSIKTPKGQIEWICGGKLWFTHKTLIDDRIMFKMMTKSILILIGWIDLMPDTNYDIYNFVNYPEIVVLYPEQNKWIIQFRINEIIYTGTVGFDLIGKKWSSINCTECQIFSGIRANEINGNYQYKLNYLSGKIY